MHAVGSLLAGGGIQVLNLEALERSVRVALGLRRARTSVLGAAVLVARSALLLAMVFWVLAAADVNVLGFAVGLLLAVPASIWHGLEGRESR